MRKTKVLFVCVHDSARSQMAEAWLNTLFGADFEAMSAGLEPGTLNPYDVQLLHAELDKLNASNLGVVLKIENQRAFENLPALLLASLERPPVGIMVARGDQAVEVGFERLAEVQEEILWLCEAAHIPVIWATQVLESMAKTGRPSRG